VAPRIWVGSIAPSHYPATGGVHQYGDVVDVDDEIVKADPDRWAEVPAPAKGKTQATTPEEGVN
jgi:hypothetical protein